MKKILVILVSIFILFNLFACRNNSIDQNYNTAVSMLETAMSNTMRKTAINPNSFAFGLNLDASCAVKYGAITISPNLIGELKVKMDYDNTDNSQIYGKISGVIPNFNNLTGSSSNVFNEMYYNNDYIYTNDNVDKIKYISVFEDSFGTDLNDFIEKMNINLGIDRISEQMGDVNLLEDISKESFLNLLRKINDPSVALLIDVLNENLTDADFRSDKYIDVSITSSKIKLSLNYDNLKNLLLSTQSNYQLEITKILEAYDQKTEVLKYEELANYINFKLISYHYFYHNSRISDVFEHIFSDVDDPDFISLMEYVYGNEYSFSNLRAAALSFSTGTYYVNLEKKKMTDWIIINDKVRVLDYIKNYTSFNYNVATDIEVSNIIKSLIDLNDGLDVFIQVLPSLLNFDLEFNFNSQNVITSIKLLFDLKMKIPVNGDGQYNDVEASLDILLSIESDPSKIVITPPVGLDSYRDVSYSF